MTASPPADEWISPDFPYELLSIKVHDARMSYIDTGPNNEGTMFIFLHGNPTSSYLWRNIIPHVRKHARCVAPDLIAMGRSEKPANFDARFRSHAVYLDAFMEFLTNGRGRVYLVLHDWGSALGLNWACRHEHRVAGLVLMEFLRPWPTWEDVPGSPDAKALFRRFRDPDEGRRLLIEENLFIEHALPASICRKLTETEMAHYRAPFRDPADREPLYRFPNELPIANSPPDVYAVAEAYYAWLLASDVEKLFFWATPGALVSERDAAFYARKLLNCRSVCLGRGYHYIQEDHPHRIGREISDWFMNLESV